VEISREKFGREHLHNSQWELRQQYGKTISTFTPSVGASEHPRWHKAQELVSEIFLQ
jgi:hypothetical protein